MATTQIPNYSDYNGWQLLYQLDERVEKLESEMVQLMAEKKKWRLYSDTKQNRDVKIDLTALRGVDRANIMDRLRAVEDVIDMIAKYLKYKENQNGREKESP